MPPPINLNPRRKNGFSPPFTAAQVSTWIALPLLIVEFLLLVAPVLPLAASIPCTIVFAVTAALSAYYAFMAQLIDPMDEYLAKSLKAEQNGEPTETNGFGGCLGGINDPAEPLKHCWLCETQVAEHAMHCKFCNKCVGNFDHHCLWLNTCVGKANYHYFLFTMIYITLMLIVHCATQIALIIVIFLGGVSKESANEWFQLGAANVVVGIYIGFVIFDAIALSLILQLLQFHMHLRKEGLTTYKYIVRETQRKREKLNREEARKNQRMVAMGKANDEGKCMLALRLRYGDMCPYCDPLPPLEDIENKNKENGGPTNNHLQQQDSSSAASSNGAAVASPQPPQVELNSIESDDDPEDRPSSEKGTTTSNGYENGNGAASNSTSNGENGSSVDQVKFINVGQS